MEIMDQVSNVLSRYLSHVGNIVLKKNPVGTLAEGKYDKLKSEPAASFITGFGKASILPVDWAKKKYYVAGYGENNPAVGVLDEPHVHALWVDDRSGRGAVLFISCDCVGILNKDIIKLRSAVKIALGDNYCRSVNIFCTHNHAGIDTMGIWGPLPLSGKDPKYMELIKKQMIKAAKLAVEDARESDVFYGTVQVPDMQEDIRLPHVYSKTLTRFRCVPKDGSREIWFLNFASHSESLQGCNSRISADFPQYLRNRIRIETGAETIYGVGAIGGMISMEIENEKAIREAGNDFAENTMKIGHKLGGYALQIEDEKQLTPVVDFIRQELFVPVENSVLSIAGRVHIIEADWYANAALPKKICLKTEMTYINFGGIPMLLIPCELFPELAFGGYLSEEESAEGKSPSVNPTPLTEIAGEKELLIFGLANDELGYVLPPNDFLLHPTQPYLEIPRDRLGRRHYEETNSLGPQTAQCLADCLASMMKKIKE